MSPETPSPNAGRSCSAESKPARMLILTGTVGNGWKYVKHTGKAPSLSEILVTYMVRDIGLHFSMYLDSCMDSETELLRSYAFLPTKLPYYSFPLPVCEPSMSHVARSVSVSVEVTTL